MKLEKQVLEGNIIEFLEGDAPQLLSQIEATEATINTVFATLKDMTEDKATKDFFQILETSFAGLLESNKSILDMAYKLAYTLHLIRLNADYYLESVEKGGLSGNTPHDMVQLMSSVVYRPASEDVLNQE